MTMNMKIIFLIWALLSVPSLSLASEDFLRVVMANDAEQAEQFLNQGANVNYQSEDGTSILHWAVYNNNLPLVARLIRAEARVDTSNDYGSSPMYEASENANTEMLRVLLEAGADVESPNLEGQTALMTVARTGNVEAAGLLLEHGADISRREQWQLQTPLMWAAAQLQPEMIKFLLTKGADPDAVSKVREWERRVTAEPRPQRRPPGGWTALAYAARQGCADCVKVLAEGGADLNLVSPEGISPLLMATLNGRFDAAAALIEAGADVNRWDLWGRSPLYSAVDFKTIPIGGRADLPSLDATSALDVIDMLLAAGANPNVQLKLFPPYRDLGADRGADSILGIGATPLIRAAKAGDVESVEALLASGALVDLPNNQGMTALIVASGDGSGLVDTRARYMNEEFNIEVARRLLAAGADIDAQRENGGTALHGAAGKGWNEFVKLLVSNNADIDAENNNAKTALDVASGKAGGGGFFGRGAPQIYPETTALLLELGATESKD